MQEIIAGIVTVLDVVALYLLLPSVQQRFALALWTAFLHMLFPVFGFQLGDWAMTLLIGWGQWISGTLLFFIGLQILFSAHNYYIPTMHPIILAVTASLDTFSVSISFGMLNLNKFTFILTAGIGAFVLSYVSLCIARKTFSFRGKIVNYLSGLSLIVLGIITILK